MRTCLCALLLAAAASSQDLAITGVTAHPVSSPAVEEATILVQDGLIAAVGREVPVPEGVEVLEGRGLHAYPGMIDGWTSLGLTEIRSVRGTVDVRELGDWNAALRAAAAINPFSAHIPVARVNGITTALVVPRGGLVGGVAACIELHGRTVPEMLVSQALPLRELDIPAPPVRDGSEEEKEYWRKAEEDWVDLERHLERARRAKRLRDLGLEHPAQGPVEAREWHSLVATGRHLDAGHPWLLRADRREHILAALRFARKHDLRLVLAGLRDAWQVAARLADSPHAFLVGSVFRLPAEDEPYDASYAMPAVLHRAGVRFGFMTGSSAGVRNLPYMAAMAVAHGLPRDTAVKALTLHTAGALGIEKTHGSLYPGKVADIVLYPGDPLDVRVSPRAVIIRGRRVSLETRHTRLAEPFLEK